ncbi:MAG TPA: nuclear transport factor 2 family protein [Pseudorhizobium sp.]|nr:nuclear transport factor 2 family protein [Pseudorhizobium sp.]
MIISEAFTHVVEPLIRATNSFDVEAALDLFARNAVIDDSSTGERFECHTGVRDYIGQFFIGYRTVTRLLSLQELEDGRIRARVGFTGNFGHEIGLLDIAIGPDTLITRIDADLE